MGPGLNQFDNYNPIFALLDGMTPIPMLTCDEWADKNRRLTTESSAEPGLWQTNRTPYLREILQKLSPTDTTTEVVVAKGVQLGFTESGLNCVGTYIDIDPCTIMYVMPTILLAEAVSKDRVTPMIENCPSLEKKIRPARSRDAGNTITVKQFPGGRLVLAGANSAASLRSRPCRVLIFDEVDAAPHDVDGEGSPVSLAEKRTSTYGDKRKIYKLSTPTIEGTSVIWKEYTDSDQRKFLLPCPHCGEIQELIFDNLRWTKGVYTDVGYQCQGCETLIEEKHKTEMLLNGRWVAQNPSHTNPNKVGYHINSLYSPVGWLSWEEIARQYDKAEDENDNNLRKTFVNTILGLPYAETGDAPAYEGLYNRREEYSTVKLPNEITFITVGADVQKNRIELEIVGWATGKRSYSIDYRALNGQTHEQGVWNELAKVLGETFTREDGRVLPVKMMCVDSGYNSSYVYDFCRRFDPTKVAPVKGQDSQSVMIAAPKLVDITIDGVKTGNVMLWNIGVSLIKSEIYGFLKSEKNLTTGEAPAGYCYFPKQEPPYDSRYFQGLTSEVLRLVKTKGTPRYQWEKVFERNEPLDCRVYARAAAAMVGIDRFTERDYELISGTAVRVKKKREFKSDFWGNRLR